MGCSVGISDGMALGFAVGLSDGMALGMSDGMALGFAVGLSDGMADGIALGFAVGLSDGMALGRHGPDRHGAWVSCRVERRDGTGHVRWHGAWVSCRIERRMALGMSDGMALGFAVGLSDGWHSVCPMASRLGLLWVERRHGRWHGAWVSCRVERRHCTGQG